MDETQFMGLLIGCVATLVGIATGIVAIIIKPVINLNRSITKLNDSIDHLNGQNATLEQRVTKHGKEIDENTKTLIVHGEDIKHLKEAINK